MAKKGRRATEEERIIAVQLIESGETFDSVAKNLNVSRRSVLEWWRQYREGGLAALSTKFTSGRPTTLSDRQMLELRALLLGSDPRQHSFGIALWTRAYRVHAAQDRAELRVRRPKVRRLEADRRLHDEVAAGLAGKWSPQRIAGRLVGDHPADSRMRVSRETIYQALYLQARGELRTELKVCLRQGRARRRPRGVTRVRQARIAGMVGISERPAEVADRVVPGHWEGDLVIGKGGRSLVATLVERSTRFLMLVQIPYDRTAERVAARLATEIRRLPQRLKRSLTWDQGVELAAHAKFSVAAEVPVYFCDPHSPWRRGSNENTNGLIRQYLPKGTDLSWYTQDRLNWIAASLNERPRQTLGFKTPAEKFDELLRAAGDALTT